MASKDITGLRTGRLTVLKKTDRKAVSREYLWECICDCGNTVYYKGSHLNCKCPVLSCGCLPIDKGNHAAMVAVYGSYRYSAKQRGYDFELTLDEFESISTGDCHYCGDSGVSFMTRRNNTFVYTGIDRIHNEFGYITNNVISCCKVCNRAKHTMSYEDFMEWIKRLGRRY